VTPAPHIDAASAPPASSDRVETTTVTGSKGVRLAVQDHGGDGPTVLLVHGYPDDHHVWDLVVADLTADHRVVTYDVRGAGGSEAPAATADYRLEHLVADLAAVIDAVSPDEAVHLVAHDWGSIQTWAAVTDARVARRVASYTSLSGPGLDHVANWMAARRRPGWTRWREAAGQGLHSWYIVTFHTPIAPLAFKAGLGRRWGAILQRGERVIVDDAWPGPDITDDAVNGMRLYRANMFQRIGRPERTHTDVPVQLVVALRDPFVPPRLLDGIEDIAPDLVRVEVDAKHWLPRSKPEVVARLAREHIARVRSRSTSA
jgi:pimeloyl-ACP methyl ester carboxylesterase